MFDFFEGTCLGATIRLFTRAKCPTLDYTQYVDHQDRHSGRPMGPLGNEERSDKNLTTTVEAVRNCSNLRAWSIAKKSFVTTQICIYTFVIYCGSSIFVPSEGYIIEEFETTPLIASLGLALYVIGYGIGPLLFAPLSEITRVGRNPVYLSTFAVFIILSIVAPFTRRLPGVLAVRFLQGFFGSPCLAMGGATIGDMFSTAKMPYPLAAWAASMYSGPALGPLLSGFTVMFKGWRWSLWELLWLSIPVFIFMCIFLPETSIATIEFHQSKHIQNSKEATNSNHDHVESSDTHSAQQILRDALVKPFEISLKDPAVAFTHFYTSLTYGIYYSFFEAFPLVYMDIYGFNLGETGAAFLCVLIACVIGVVCYCGFYRLYDESRTARNDGSYPYEKYLRSGLPASFGPPIGLFLFGWSARSEVHWCIPTLGIIIYCASTFVILLGIFMYLPISYPRYAASLFAANDMLRSTFAAGAILFARPLYVNLGVDRGISVLGGSSVLGIIGLCYLYINGEKLRKRSTFASD